MAKVKEPIETVRASRAGHEYHEVWTARHAMQLLLPNSPLAGIAIEGLGPGDQESASADTVEIADLTFYYGERAGFKHADRACIAQFKYSIRNKSKPYRASAAKEVIEKFGKAYRSLKSKHGAKLVREKVTFEIHTNQPVYAPLIQGIEALAQGKTVTGDAKSQADAFKQASGLIGGPLSEFASKFHIQNLNDSLGQSQDELTRTIVDWSGGGVDALARALLGDLKQLIQDKAGHHGTGRNLIGHTDILGVFGLSETSELLPCPEALAKVSDIVEREQLPDAIRLVPDLSRPMLVHAAGGVGKTIFMDSLCRTLADDHETVFFDCFGGGDYRSPGDARHHAKRGLVHIANTLACRGLCDPIIPGVSDVDSLMNTFRRRLEQCVRTITENAPEKKLILFVDAIDNAATHARDRNEDAFPVLLAEHLEAKPIAGVRLVVSSRSHRIPIKHVAYEDCELRPFSKAETEKFLKARIPDVTQAELRVAQARSAGNPRVLEYMVETGRGLLDESEIKKKLELDDLIQARINNALAEARKNGYKKEDTDAFLAGLAVLPPPVPIDEYAEAHGMEKSAIESFASDLWPLLDRKRHGLVFRDEPTEDLVRERYASIKQPLRRVAKNLTDMQDRSVYAARALPDLLVLLGDARQLFNLAFDERFPDAITSTVGKRNIRSARLKAAIRYAAGKKDYDQLVQLTTELSTIAAVERRGADYILDCPDIVIAAQDTDATRRLFETRTEWQGTRHARLAIANTLSGDADEATRHAIATEEWTRHYWQQERTHRTADEGPQRLDDAAVPFYLFSQKRFDHAVGSLDSWPDWYSFEVGELVFELAHQPDANIGKPDIQGFLDALSDEVGAIVAALSFLNLSRAQREILIEKLVKAAPKHDPLKFPDRYSSRGNLELQYGLRKSAAIAMSYGARKSAQKIAALAPAGRPSLWSFREHFADRYVFPMVLHAALSAAANNVDVRPKDLMPREASPFSARMPNDLIGEDFKEELLKRLKKRVRTTEEEQSDVKPEGTISRETMRNSEEYLKNRFDPLLQLADALAKVLAAPRGRADKPFRHLLETWKVTRKIREGYRSDRFNTFFRLLGGQIAQLVFWSRDDLKATSVTAYLKCLHEQETLGPELLVEIISVLAKRPKLLTIAGGQAVKCVAMIGAENDVTYRAALYAKLARAILPASVEEAAAYFRAGLEQMDAIGSGDYLYTNHLLLLAASLKGRELQDADFHTLTNITELNLTDEPEKFPWYAFGQGLSRTSGGKALAKLSRWDDRGKIKLEYTLLPYITALVRDEKIAPEDALSLNWLADPAEYWGCNTETFAQALDARTGPKKKDIVLELIEQYESNNPGLSSSSTVSALADIAARTLGESSEVTSMLRASHARFRDVNDTRNEHMNFRSDEDKRLGEKAEERREASKRLLDDVAIKTSPEDEQSLSKAFEVLFGLDNAYFVRDDFVGKLRSKVSFGGRSKYIRNLAGFEHVNLYWKIDEFKKCKEAWSDSSGALGATFRDIVVSMVRLHDDDLVSDSQLSTHKLHELSELSGVSVATLALELVKLLAEPQASASATVWLGLACLMCEEAADGKGQAAVTRLLRSDAAKLSAGVVDGPWRKELYPKSDEKQIFAELVWRQLGSPLAADRWRAAHALRSFARLDRWHIIDAVVSRIDDRDAGPFQAPELPFYFLHARLWLLIALARIARDNPAQVAKYKAKLLRIVNDDDAPHVLLRHFAADALRVCLDAGEIKVAVSQEKKLRTIDDSPLPRLHEKIKNRYEDFYQGRPKGAPKPPSEFFLEYDFRKEDVQYLGHVFGEDHWRVEDLILEAIKDIDPSAESMFDAGGRDGLKRPSRGIGTESHYYGEQLAWHGLLIAAGRLLQSKPVTDDWWYEEPWQEFLARYLLTRKDGYWLADMRDRAPLDISTILMETAKKGLELTGDKQKILALAGLENGVGDGVVVAGRWFSADHIRVRINSVLVKPRKANAVIRELLAEDPISTWLPFYEEADDGSDYLGHNKDNCTPWIVFPSVQARLDAEDPLASASVNDKPRIAQEFATSLGLQVRDRFGRKWTGKSGKQARSEAWGYPAERGGASSNGHHLVCNKSLLEDLLEEADADLLLLVDLQKYDKGFQSESSKYWNTIAVIRVKQNLTVEYHKGKVNHLWESRY